MFISLIPLVLFAAVFVFLFLISGLRVVTQYERAIVFVLGRYAGTRGPGLFWIIPSISSIRKVDLRIVSLEVPPQEVITRDNVTIKVNAVVYFLVVDPAKATINITNYLQATVQIAQTTLRNVVGQSELDQVLAERERINANLQNIIDTYTENWGVKVTIVELKDIELPINMQRAMARQAEAEREKRAKIIAASGELQASKELSEAARVMTTQPMALQLRYLQTLVEVAAEKNSTIIFPFPIDLLQPLAGLSQNLSELIKQNLAAPQTPPEKTGQE